MFDMFKEIKETKTTKKKELSKIVKQIWKRNNRTFRNEKYNLKY